MRGLSILETVTALFILAGATLTLVGVFHSGLRRQAQIDDLQLGLSVAQRRLESLRDQARSYAGFRALPGLDGVYRPDDQVAGFDWAARAQRTGLFSPCSAFGERERQLEGTGCWVWVAVRWRRAPQPVRLSTLLAEPRRSLAPTPQVRFLLPPLPVPLPRDALADLKAELVDADGEPVEGVRFDFFVKPKTANARLRKRRNGKQVTLIHQLEPPQFPNDGTSYPAGKTYDPGPTVITARGRYHGQPVTGYSPPIELE